MEREEIIKEMWNILVSTYIELYPENQTIGCVANIYDHHIWNSISRLKGLESETEDPILLQYQLPRKREE